MKVNWIIENFTKENSFKELSEAVEKLGYPLLKINSDYKKKDVSEFLKSYYSEVLDINIYQNACVIANGTIKMCKILKEELENWCAPVLYSDFSKYKCSSYYSHFGPYLFNDKYCLMSLKEIVRQKFDVWGHYGKDSVIFCRPDSGEKIFQAGVLDIIDLPQLYDANKDYEHDLMLVSTPKNIKWEGRFIVSKYKEIIAYSTYRFQGNVTIIPAVPEESKKFVKELLNVGYYPDSVFCFDVCQDSDDAYWLMELTSFSSAGLYASNKLDIVKRVSEIAWEDFEKRS